MYGMWQKYKYNFFRYFTRLNIGRQMFFGYLPLVILIIITSVYALYSLNGVNIVSNSIVENDTAIMGYSEKLGDNLLAQESYAQRYIILESDEMLDIFWQRSNEFDGVLKNIEALPETDLIPFEKIRNLHDAYNQLYADYLAEPEKGVKLFPVKYEAKVKVRIDELIGVIKTMSLQVKERRDDKLIAIGHMGERAFRITAVITVAGIIIGVLAAYLITKNIAVSVHKLKVATNQISEGNFNHDLKLKTNDEFRDLAVAFSEMASRLSRWEEMYLDASPLTRLPGGVAIDNVLKKRLEAGRHLAFCLLDLDNFKSFNDKYGYAMGNVIIKTTAKIIEKSVAEYGDDGDFLGHIGGDDFAVITTPDRYVGICSNIVDEFDKTIIGFYDSEDRNRGYIEGKTRQGHSVNFPIMTMSIAVVTNSEKRVMNHLEVGEIAAELKEHAKYLPGSRFVTDRRSGSILLDS